MTRVFVKNLVVDAVIGVYDWERKIRQRLEFDITMTFDISAAALSDDLTDALDYAAVSQRVTKLVEASEYQLLEALVKSCADVIIDEFDVAKVLIEVRKPGAVPNADCVGIVLEQCR